MPNDFLMNDDPTHAFERKRISPGVWLEEPPEFTRNGNSRVYTYQSGNDRLD
jgi:hypothetical protein